MTTSARFLYDDKVSATTTTITVTDTATGFSTDYLKTNSLLVPHRTQTDTNVVYTFDLGSAMTIGAVGAAGHNVTSGALLSCQSSSDGASWSDFCTPLWGEKLIFGAASAISRRYWRLIIADGSNPDTYLEIGRIMLGPYFEPVDNFEPAYSRNEEPGGVRQEALNKAENFIVRPDRSGRGLRFPISTTAELANWRTFQKTVSNSRPFAVSLDPDNLANMDSMMARVLSLQLPRVFMPGTNEALIEFREVIG